MSDLNLAFSDYYSAVSEFLGLGSSPTGTNLTKVKNIVYRGYKRFLYPSILNPQTGKKVHHNWSFLKRQYTLVTESGKWKYPLPEDFGRILTDPEFSSNAGYDSLIKRSAEFILRQRNISDSSSYPWYYAITASEFDSEIGTTWELWLNDTPDQSYTLHFWYKIHVPKPENATDLLIGGIDTQEALLESCLAVAEQQEEDGTSTIHTQLAADLIQSLISADDIDRGKSLGRMSRPGQCSEDSTWRSILTNIDDTNIYSGD
jgi:hypothetical protein